MADDSREFKIKISTAADTSGVKETGQELNNLSDKTKDYIKELENQDGKEKESVATKGEVRRGLREIGRELPILGELGRLAMEPLIAGFVAIAAVVAKAFDGIKELGNRGTPEFEKLTGAVEEQKKAMEELQETYDAYERSVARMSAATQSVQDQAKQFQSGLSARHGADDSILGKTHERDIAALEAAEKMGLITHQEYLVRKLAADEAYFKKRMDLQNQYEFEQMKGKAQERFAVDMDARATEKKLTGERETAKQAAGASKFAAGKVSQDDANLKKTEDKIAELQKEYEDLNAPTFTEALTRSTYVTAQRIKQNEAEQVAQMEIADKLRAAKKKDEEGAGSASERAAAAKEDVDADQERRRKDLERVHQLDTELPHDLQQYRFDKATRQGGADIDSATRAIEAAGRLSSESVNKLGATVINGHADLQRQIDTIVRNVGDFIRQQSGRGNSGLSGPGNY